MKVLSVNFSRKGELGATEMILQPFLEGMRAAGADVTAVHANRLTIKPCLAEFACWRKTPGECIQKDDMGRLCALLAQADLWVFAAPVYVDGVGGLAKTAMDRTLPLVTELIEDQGGRSRHPLRPGVKAGDLFLVSTCGYWEMETFGPMVGHIEAFGRQVSRRFCGALLRPHAGALARLAREGGPVGDVLDACTRAGAELARCGRVSDETAAVVSRPLVTRGAFLERSRARYDEELGRLDLERPIAAC